MELRKPFVTLTPIPQKKWQGKELFHAILPCKVSVPNDAVWILAFAFTGRLSNREMIRHIISIIFLTIFPLTLVTHLNYGSTSMCFEPNSIMFIGFGGTWFTAKAKRIIVFTTQFFFTISKRLVWLSFCFFIRCSIDLFWWVLSWWISKGKTVKVSFGKLLDILTFGLNGLFEKCQ